MSSTYNVGPVNATQKMGGLFNPITGDVELTKLRCAAGLEYDPDNITIEHNPAGTADNIVLNGLPLLSNASASYRIRIRGGSAMNSENIIATITVNFADYNNAGQQPLKIPIGDNDYTHIWVDVDHYQMNAGHADRTNLFLRKFFLSRSPSGARESYIDYDRISFVAATNDLEFNSNSIPPNSTIFVYHNNGGILQLIDGTTGALNPAYIGMDVPASPVYPISYRIADTNLYNRQIVIRVVNKSDPADIAWYGTQGSTNVDDFTPQPIIRESVSGNYIYGEKIEISNDLSQAAGVRLREGSIPNGKFVMVTGNGVTLSGFQKVAGTPLFIPFGANTEALFTATNFTITVTDDAAGLVNPVTTGPKNINSVFGPRPATTSVTLDHTFAGPDRFLVCCAPAGKRKVLELDDTFTPTGQKIAIFGSGTSVYTNIWETLGCGYQWPDNVQGTNRTMDVRTYNWDLRQVGSTTNYTFDNTPPTIPTDVQLVDTANNPLNEVYIQNLKVSGGNARFICDVTDDIAMGTATLQLSYDGTNWTDFTMTNTGGTRYEVTLDGASFGWFPTGPDRPYPQLFYRITARDAVGNPRISAVNNQMQVYVAPESTFIAPPHPNPMGVGGDLELELIIGKDGAQSVKFEIFDSNGNLKKDWSYENKQGDYFYDLWDGADNEGTTLGVGSYKLKVTVIGNQKAADLNYSTTITIQDPARLKDPEKEKMENKEWGCFGTAIGLDKDVMVAFRGLRDRIKDTKADPEYLAAAKQFIRFYYKDFSPWYKKNYSHPLLNKMLKAYIEHNVKGRTPDELAEQFKQYARSGDELRKLLQTVNGMLYDGHTK